jgi:hypothetical protein
MCAWEWYDDANVFRLFIHLLLNANHADLIWRGITIKRGQKFTSVKHLSEELKLSEKAIRIAMGKLKKTGEIDLKGASNGTMITICKYETYQTPDEDEGQATGQTKGKRRATNKNDKNKEIDIWKNDFSVYQRECAEEFTRLSKDEIFLEKLKMYNSGVDIMKSLQKLYDDYWNTEEGWINKKKSKVNKINWATTISNTIKFHKVYYTKQELAEMERR